MPPRHAAIAREPREEKYAIRHEAREGSCVLPASGDEQDEDEDEVDEEAHPGGERGPLPTCHRLPPEVELTIEAAFELDDAAHRLHRDRIRCAVSFEHADEIAGAGDLRAQAVAE